MWKTYSDRLSTGAKQDRVIQMLPSDHLFTLTLHPRRESLQSKAEKWALLILNIPRRDPN